jgi:hypothetical protein
MEILHSLRLKKIPLGLLNFIFIDYLISFYLIYHNLPFIFLYPFRLFAKPASGGGPKPTFINILNKVYTFATITGGVEASTKMTFDLIQEGY